MNLCSGAPPPLLDVAALTKESNSEVAHSVCQDIHSRMPALSFATDRDSPGARDDIQRDKYSWMQDAFPPKYKPCDSPDSASASSRIQGGVLRIRNKVQACYVACDADIRLVFRSFHRILRGVSRVRGSLRTKKSELRAHQMARKLRSPGVTPQKSELSSHQMARECEVPASLRTKIHAELL